jgi:hypothetical protein
VYFAITPGVTPWTFLSWIKTSMLPWRSRVCRRLGLPPGELVLQVALDLLRFGPTACPGFQSVLLAVCRPTEMPSAIAAFGELVPGVFARLPVCAAVPDKDGDKRTCHPARPAQD